MKMCLKRQIFKGLARSLSGKEGEEVKIVLAELVFIAALGTPMVAMIVGSAIRAVTFIQVLIFG